jgi:hypothetical protein
MDTLTTLTLLRCMAINSKKAIGPAVLYKECNREISESVPERHQISSVLAVSYRSQKPVFRGVAVSWVRTFSVYLVVSWCVSQLVSYSVPVSARRMSSVLTVLKRSL